MGDAERIAEIDSYYPVGVETRDGTIIEFAPRDLRIEGRSENSTVAMQEVDMFDETSEAETSLDLETGGIDELAEYSDDAKASILRGLQQKETVYLGSFAQYVE